MKIKRLIWLVILVSLGLSMLYAEELVYKNRETVVKLLENRTVSLKELDNIYQKDRKLVLIYLENDGNISNIDSSFLEDNEFILSYLKKTGKGLQYATKKQRANKQLILEVLKLNSNAFKYVDDSLKKDRDFILNQVSKISNYRLEYLSYIDKTLLEDKAFFYELSKKNQFVSKSSFYSDKTLMLKLIDELEDFSELLPHIDKNLFRDESFMLKVIRKTGYGLEYASKEHQSDDKLILEALNHYVFDGWEYLDGSLWKDKEFVLRVLERKSYYASNIFNHIDVSLQKDREVIFAYAGKSKELIDELDKEFQDDKEFVLEYLNKVKYGLKYASIEQKDNRTLVLSILKNNADEYKYVSDRLKDDKTVSLIACKGNFSNWKYLPNILSEDKVFLLKLIDESDYLSSYNWENIESSLQKDREVIFAYAGQSKDLIDVLDKELQNDKQFVLEYVQEIGYGFKYLSKENQNNKELILSTLDKSLEALKYADKNITEDRSFILKALGINAYMLENIAQKFQDDKEIVLSAVKKSGAVIEYASKRLQKEEEIIIAAEKQDGSGWAYASDALKKNRAFLLSSVKHSDDRWKDVNETFKKDKSFMLEAIKAYASEFQFVDESLKKDKAFILDALETNGDILEYLDEGLKKDKEFIHLIVKKSVGYFKFAHRLLKNDKEFIFEFIEKDIDIRSYLGGKLKKDKKLMKLLSQDSYDNNYSLIDEEHKYGLEPIKCWLGNEENLSNVECYNVHVPEIHNDETSRTITFPLRIFRSLDNSSVKNPVLHLGGGGPGGPMYLDYPSSLQGISKSHDGISLNQGRDLLLIDPRGAGLSKPLLNCSVYADNVLLRLTKTHTIEEEFSASERDYLECIQQFKEDKVNFNGYNSEQISHDVEMLRKFLKVDKWVLFGVSYGTTYAMHVNRKYPKSVEKMILDSACFPNLQELNHIILNAPPMFSILYDYANVLKEMGIDDNISMDINVKKRMWALHEKLNKHPIEIGTLNFKIDGNIFVDSLIMGIYRTDIFKQLPKVIVEMENNNTKTFLDVFENYYYFLVNKDYGDISMLTHYCYEAKPFIDFDKINKQILELPEGYIRERALLLINFNNFCKEMNITSADKGFEEAVKTDVPTLFIQGEFDMVTPLTDVLEQMKGFSNSKVLSFKKSHSVMEDGKIEDAVAEFVEEYTKSYTE